MQSVISVIPVVDSELLSCNSEDVLEQLHQILVEVQSSKRMCHSLVRVQDQQMKLHVSMSIVSNQHIESWIYNCRTRLPQTVLEILQQVLQLADESSVHEVLEGDDLEVGN